MPVPSLIELVGDECVSYAMDSAFYDTDALFGIQFD